MTSLRDGMNLVSYEFIACQASKKGVLILSEVNNDFQSFSPWLMQKSKVQVVNRRIADSFSPGFADSQTSQFCSLQVQHSLLVLELS